MKIVWTKKGRASLAGIKDYIDTDSSIKSREFIKELLFKVRLLTDAPFIGRELPEPKKSDIREILHGDYRILYCVRDFVYVFRIIHSRQDFHKLNIRPDIPPKPKKK